MNNPDHNPAIPPYWMFRIIRWLKLRLKRLEAGMMPPSVMVFEKAQAFWISKAIGVACDLNLADMLMCGPKSIKEIAGICAADEEALYRMMRALAGEGIFRESPAKVFSNTKLSKGLASGKGSMKNMIRHQMNPANWNLIGQLGYSVKTGKCSARELFGEDIFTHLGNNPDKNELYNKAMTDTSYLSAAAFLRAYPFHNFENIVDIGGGEGTLIAMILLKYPGLRGIVFDLPHVIKNAEGVFLKFGIEDRATWIEGDFFKSALPKGDAYIMKNILHAFDDDRCIQLLRNIAQTMDTRSRLLIFESAIGEDNLPAFGKIFDLQMLIGTDGGRERTGREYGQLLSNSGFRLTRIIPTVSPFSIMEAVKERD